MLVVGFVGTVEALTGTRAVFWFVLFARSGLGAAFAPLIVFAVLGGAVNRYGALAVSRLFPVEAPDGTRETEEGRRPGHPPGDDLGHRRI